MHKIIIDTDPGIDDAQAIAFALAHPEIELLGLTTVFGNAPIDITTRNALTVLQEFSAANIPVAQGADKPLVQERFEAPSFVHGDDGMGNLNLPTPKEKPLKQSAARFIIEQANTYPGEVTVVAIGPLSNIAHALSLDTELHKKLKGLVVMGGAVDHVGNVSPVAEANFINDPHAADIVCAHDFPLTVIGLDVTMKTVLTDEHLKQLKDGAGHMGSFLWESSRYYVDFYSSLLNPIGGGGRGCAMHDASAIIYVVEPEAFELVKGTARVATKGVAQGQFILNRGNEHFLLPHWQNHPEVFAAMKVDSKKVLDVFVSTIIKHAST